MRRSVIYIYGYSRMNTRNSQVESIISLGPTRVAPRYPSSTELHRLGIFEKLAMVGRGRGRPNWVRGLACGEGKALPTGLFTCFSTCSTSSHGKGHFPRHPRKKQSTGAPRGDSRFVSMAGGSL